MKIPGRKFRWIENGILGAVCALVIGLYALEAQTGMQEAVCLTAADTFYNRQVQGFRAGQLNIKMDVPPGFAQLADPFDPTANIIYRSPPYLMDDLIYYKHRLYLYYGLTPVLILFWPSVALTGHYLFHKQAVLLFCSLGFLASVVLLGAAWRRYFARVSVWVVAAGALALGLTTLVPLLLSRCEIYEVAISCGSAFMMLALAALWRAMHHQERRGWWLAVASLLYGLAVAARPSLLFGAVMLLAPLAQVWRDRKNVGVVLLAALGPMLLIGVGLMIYNWMRFDHPFEFGLRYALAGDRQATQEWFSLRYWWFNFRLYFLEPARWSSRFPFVHDVTEPPLPAGHGLVEHPFGVLSNIPVVWLSLVVALGWRERPTGPRAALGWFFMALLGLSGFCALTVCFFFSTSSRYEVDFLPPLILLSVFGILTLEQTLAQRPAWRQIGRCGWGLLLSFSVAVNLLLCVDQHAETDYTVGLGLAKMGRESEAIAHFERAVQLKPDHARAYDNLGRSLLQMGKPQEAIEQFKKALQLQSHNADAECNLGVAFAQTGNATAAIEHYQQALRLDPNFAGAHYDLGIALSQIGRVSEAIGHWEQAVRINPDYVEAHNNLGVALSNIGREPEAIDHWEEAVRINPNYAEAHNNLGAAFERTGRVPEAIVQYELALRVQPDLAAAKQNLARLHASP